LKKLLYQFQETFFEFSLDYKNVMWCNYQVKYNLNACEYPILKAPCGENQAFNVVYMSMWCF